MSIRMKKKLLWSILVVFMSLLFQFNCKSALAFEVTSESIFNTTFNGDLNYVYDSTGRLIHLVLPSGQIIEHQYDKNGNMTRKFKSDNLLVNSSYEVNTNVSGVADAWSKIVTAGSDTIQVVHAPVSSGKGAARISGTGISKDKVIGIYQLIKVDQNKAFNLSGRVNIASLIDAKAQIYVEFYKDPNHIIAVDFVDSTLSTNDNFMTLALNGTVPTNAVFAKINILLRASANEASGTFYVDSMNFQYSNEVNKISNFDCEVNTKLTGVADDWSKLVTAGSDTIQLVQMPVNSGRNAQRISGTRISKDKVVGIYQLIKVEGNSTFSIGGGINVSSLVNAKAQIYVEFFSDMDHIVSVHLVDWTTTTDGKYKMLSINGIVPINATFAKVNFLLRATSDGASGTFYVDTMKYK